MTRSIQCLIGRNVCRFVQSRSTDRRIASGKEPNELLLMLTSRTDERLAHTRDVGALGLIDGRRYYHILVENHAWLMACPADGSGFIWAETLAISKDMPAMAKRFPHLVERHAARPVAPMREAVLQ